MPRCDIHELLPYGGQTCPDCTADSPQPADVVDGPWHRENLDASDAEEPEPLIIHLA